MATHPRTAIRDYIVSALGGGAISEVGDRVYASRVRTVALLSGSGAYRPDQLPLIAVYADQDEADRRTDAAAWFERKLRLAVDILVNGTDGENAHDVLDSIAQQVETIVHTDETQNGTANTTETGLSNFGWVPTPGAIFGVCTINFELTYEWQLDDLDAADLESVFAGYDLENDRETLIGNVHDLVEGAFYYVPAESDTVGGVHGPFLASSAYIEDFTSASQHVYTIDARDRWDLT